MNGSLHRHIKAALLAILAVSMAGCFQIHGLHDVEVDPPPSEPPPLEERINQRQDALLGPITQADVLVVVDDSHSMATKQQLLSYALPWLAEGIIEGDIDRDGSSDFPGILDIHFGVITPTDGGQMGVLRHDCGLDTNILQYPSAETASLEDFSDGASCLVNVGAHGYSLEQPLESMLRALSNSRTSIPFASPDAAQADRANRGFLRGRSLLVIVTLTDEDDCSGANREAFLNHPSAGEENMRCYVHPEVLYPVGRYVEGISAARGGDLSRVLFMPIIGIPINEIQDADSADYDRLLELPRMAQYRQMNGSDRRFACLPSSGDGSVHSADPGRRLLSFAQGLDDAGATVVTESICDGDYSGGVEALLDTIARRVQASYDAQDAMPLAPPVPNPPGQPTSS